MSQLYLECTSGISGDMTVGALLDLGADREKLLQVLDTVPAEGFSVRISTVSRSGMEACDFAVDLDHAHENHDHDMEYLHGPEGPRDCPPWHRGPEGPQDCPPRHCGPEGPWECPPRHRGPEGPQDCPPRHCGPEGPWDCPPPYRRPEGPQDCPRHCGPEESHHEHRGLSEVYGILDGTQMTEDAREAARKIFRLLAEAEGQVHGLPPEEVHFHEVGAIDSIIDIIAIAVCYDDLREKEDITEVIVPVLYDGMGTVRCQHGVLPVPVPAVTEIARRSGIRLHLMPDRGEFVTPTGAAVVAALRTRDCLPEEFSILKTGLGAGKRPYPGHTGLLRAMLIE